MLSHFSHFTINRVTSTSLFSMPSRWKAFARIFNVIDKVQPDEFYYLKSRVVFVLAGSFRFESRRFYILCSEWRDKGSVAAKLVLASFFRPWRCLRLCAIHSFSNVLDPRFGAENFKHVLLQFLI